MNARSAVELVLIRPLTGSSKAVYELPTFGAIRKPIIRPEGDQEGGVWQTGHPLFGAPEVSERSMRPDGSVRCTRLSEPMKTTGDANTTAPRRDFMMVGSRIAIRMAMMPIVTNSSTSVKPRKRLRRDRWRDPCPLLMVAPEMPALPVKHK